MANEKKKVTNTNNKNKKTTTKKTAATKATAAKKVTPKKVAPAKKTTTKKTVTPKKETATAVKKTPTKKVAATKKTTTVTTKKAAKKVVNNTKGKNTTKKATSKKQAPKKVEKKVVEPKKIEKKVEVSKEEPSKIEKVDSKKAEKKITLSTSAIYTIVGLAVLAVVIVLSIVINPSSGKYDENNNNNGTINTGSSPANQEQIPEDKRKELNSINIDEYLEMLKGEEAKVIYIGRPTCSHCVAQKPVMENISFEYDVTINYLNTDELDDDGINKLVSSNEYFSEGFGTPLTLIVKNDEIVDKAVGETSKTDMVNMFKKNSIIK